MPPAASIWKQRRWIAALATLLVLGSLHLPAAAAPARSPTAMLEPLSDAEFDAAVAEARRRMRHEDPVGRDWSSLDRERLARLLSMPAFAALDDNTKAPLIDQAGAWELMSFERPSEALAMWARWYPTRGIGKPVTPDTRTTVYRPNVFYADERWAREAGAMIALLQCMPAPVWVAYHEEPMLWAMEQHAGWEQPNLFDFGKCVRKQREDGRVSWPTSPDTARGKASAAVLEEKLTRYLLRFGCSGKGPDSCLPLLHALLSLNPQDRHLVAILKTLEPEIAPTEEVRIPERFRNRNGNLTDSEYKTMQGIRRVILRKAIYLTAKLPVLLENPAQWPQGELEETVALLVNAAVTLDRMDVIQAGLGNNLKMGEQSYLFASPWAKLPRDLGKHPALATVFGNLGRRYAEAPGCGLAPREIKELPAQFWYAYALAKLEREQTTCDAMPYRWVAQVYTEAAHRQRYGLLKPIDGLWKFIQEGTPAQVGHEIIGELGKNCPKSAAHDPWRICAAKEKYLKKIAAEERQGEKTRKPR